jgi:large conductance mechanosensitive channel
MSLVREFREFAVKGNVVDMAVGIIIGGAFATIARSLVDDIVMPPIGLLLGNIDFKQMFWVLKPGVNGVTHFNTMEAAKSAGAVTVNYGNFINNVVTFLIVAFAIFILVRSINRLRRQQQSEPAAATDKACAYCATTIPVKAVRCPNCTSDLAA